MDKRLKKARTFSIVASILFLLCTFYMLFITSFLYNIKAESAERSDYSDDEIYSEFGEEVFDWYTKIYDDEENKHFDDCDEFRDYYAERADAIEPLLYVSLVLAAGFLLYSAGALISLKKSFTIPFILAQIIPFISALMMIISSISSLAKTNSVESAVTTPLFLAVLIFSPCHIIYTILNRIKGVNLPRILANLFAIPMVTNIISAIVSVFFCSFYPEYSKQNIVLLYITMCALLFIIPPFVLYYIGAHLRYKAYRKPLDTPPQPIVYAVPSQVVYHIPPQQPTPPPQVIYTVPPQQFTPPPQVTYPAPPQPINPADKPEPYIASTDSNGVTQ